MDWTGPSGNLAIVRWAGWPDGQVDRHVKCRSSEWNGGGGLWTAWLGKEGSTWIRINYLYRGSEFLVTPLLMGPGCLVSHGRFGEPVCPRVSK